MKKRNLRKSTKRKPPATPIAAEVTRRSILASAPYAIAGAVALGGIGYFGVSAVRADLAEQDLSIVGSGRPVIVQVHDPSCPVCLALQKEARAALKLMDDGAPAYRVASITSNVGLAFANSHGASHATLLFFDGSGKITQRVHGATDRETLYTEFMTHIAARN